MNKVVARIIIAAGSSEHMPRAVKKTEWFRNLFNKATKVVHA